MTFVMADFCIDADRNFMDAMKLDSADDFAYYVCMWVFVNSIVVVFALLPFGAVAVCITLHTLTH